MEIEQKNGQAPVPPKRYKRLRVLLMLIALFFLAYGIYDGQAAYVMQKAVRICLECIGIG